MKTLPKFTPSKFANRIAYKDAWFSGKVVVLTEKEFGPGDSLISKAVSLRGYARRTYGLPLRLSLDHNNWTIQVQLVLDK